MYTCIALLSQTKCVLNTGFYIELLTRLKTALTESFDEDKTRLQRRNTMKQNN